MSVIERPEPVAAMEWWDQRQYFRNAHCDQTDTQNPKEGI